MINRTVAALALTAQTIIAAPATGQAKLSVPQWQKDLAFVRSELPARHRNFFHDISREEFDGLMTALERDLPQLSDDEIVIRLAAIVARAATTRDGHSGVTLRPRFQMVPVNFFQYSDGLHVRGVAREYAELLGVRVTTIGGAPLDRAMAAVKTIASGDNDMSRMADISLILTMPGVLRALGLTEGERDAPIEIAGVREDGTRVAIPVAPVKSFDGIEWLDVRRQAASVPLYLRHSDPNPFYWFRPLKTLWYEHLPEQKALYVHYGAVADTPDETVAAFFARTFAFAEAKGVEKFVIDLRHNGGGNNTLNRPFLHGIIKRDEGLGKSGRFFVLIGRHTFSAAQNIVTQLERETNVIFVGEPTGGSPNHYGDATRIVLPNSGVTLRASTLWWQDAHPNDERPWISPQIAADFSSKDDRAGRDPALEAVLAYKPEPSLSELLRAALASGGKAAAEAAYTKWRSEPRRKYTSGESDVLDLAVAFYGEKKADHALILFELNAAAYPQSWRAHEGLGRAYQAAKRNEEAVAAYKRAIALSDKAVVSKERLAALTNPAP